MTKEELQQEIVRLEQQLRQKQEEENQFDEKYDALVAFATQCESHAESFNASVNRRRRKLGLINGLLQTVKAAAGYQKRMSSALNGEAFQSTKASVDELIRQVNKQKTETKEQSQDCARQIDRLRELIRQKKQELQTVAQEEAAANG